MSSKWGRMSHKMMVWQVVHEVPILITVFPSPQHLIYVELISAGVKGPEVDDMLSMRDPNKMTHNGHGFRVLSVTEEQPGSSWKCVLESLFEPGFEDYPDHITPLAFTKKLQPKEQ